MKNLFKIAAVAAGFVAGAFSASAANWEFQKHSDQWFRHFRGQSRQFAESLRSGKQLLIQIDKWKGRFSLSNSDATIGKVLQQCE